VFVASFILGPTAARSWTSYLAPPLAALVGFGVATAPSEIRQAHIDGDSLWLMSTGLVWAFFIMPLVIVALLGAVARTGISRASKSPDDPGTGTASPASTAETV
jgi:hypothetical protein